MNAHVEKDAQQRRFTEAAKAAGADEDEAAFRAKLGVIARQRPVPEPPAEKPKREKHTKA